MVRGNVSMRWALVATAASWATIPALWSVNDWGVLSLAELFWLLLVAAAWLLALAGIGFPPWRELAVAMAVVAWSSVLPTVLLLWLLS